MTVELHHGDCLDVLRIMPADSIDAIVTDPPYGLAFMGKKWDYDVPSVEIWVECLRVLKPGGHLLAFAGTRTQHRMAVRIEDAGFEIRDMIAWIYGSGFPKSLDVSKAIDKAAGAEREVVGRRNDGRYAYGFSEEAKRAQGGTAHEYSAGWVGDPTVITAPATDAARQWQGWGTALKPSLEPVTVARKPLIGTVAENVLAHGTGALNIDGCRVEGMAQPFVNGTARHGGQFAGGGENSSVRGVWEPSTAGRWPANLIHDGSEEVLAGFPLAPGQMAKASTSDTQRAGQNTYGAMTRGSNGQEPRRDAGSAARFFYCAKASKSDRGEDNNHPTVKPTDLMRYLCRLVTPSGGTVLDPFMGSGSTGKAAVLEGFRFIGIERDVAYIEIARARIARAPASQPDMFSLAPAPANPA